MTRQLKFRAWDTISKEMWDLGSLRNIVEDDQTPDGGRLIYLQYTGLKDKNGNPIYEGDIISMHNKQYNVVVEFTDYGYQGLHKQSGYYEGLTTFIEDHEIIGNIYENPELLN